MCIRDSPLPANALAFTVAGVPIIYERVASTSQLSIFRDGTANSATRFAGTQLDATVSNELLQRTGKIHRVLVQLGPEIKLPE